MKLKLLIPAVAAGLFSTCALRAAIFIETFESATFAATGTAGATYSGGESWVVADPVTSSNPVKWSVNTGLGWTANDAGGNDYLFANGAGGNTGNDSTIFRASGWNTGSAELITVSFEFAMNPGTQGASSWGAIILSSTAFASNAAPDNTTQNVHVRIQQNGGSGTLGTASTVGGYGGTYTLGTGVVNTLTISYNGGLSTINGIDSNRGSIVLNGTPIVTNADLRNGTSSAGIIDMIEFRAFGTLNGTAGTPMNAWFDDVSISAVPEPSTYAIYAGLLALGWVVMRRRLRN